ncbi:MAG: hypothetical protein HKN79_06345 [Flavobacteriales bacterium]|nr:hypothetical protein [Flavobacteriales bacterium]
MSTGSLDFKGVIFRMEEGPDTELLERLPDHLQDFYQEINGIIAYNGGLQIRSCIDTDDWHSLGRFWKGERSLSRIYPNLLESDIPFAQDCLGDQYFLRDDQVWILSGETGDVMDMEVDLPGFIEQAIDDPVEFLAMEPLAYYLQTEGDLQPGELLHVVPALSEQEDEETAYHIEALSVEKRLDWLHDYFKQHHSSVI